MTAATFRYAGYDLDPARGRLTCRYSLDDREFAERDHLPGRWRLGQTRRRRGRPAAVPARRRLVLQGRRAAGDRSRRHRRSAGRARRSCARSTSTAWASSPTATASTCPACSIDGAARSTRRRRRRTRRRRGRAADPVRRRHRLDRHRRARAAARADAALFVVNRPGDRFAAIEAPAAVTGLPVVRAERRIDPQVLRSRELGFLNGHVPVTGIISAIAVLAAVLTARDAVVMSNEWSASSAT